MKVYILNCNIEEIEHKSIQEITDDDFKVLGDSYTIEQFQDWLNYPEGSPINIEICNCWIRFIDDSNDKFMDSFSKSVGSGLTIYFVENPAAPEGKAYLHINPKNMPKV